MVEVRKRYITEEVLEGLMAHPEAFNAFIPNGTTVWKIGGENNIRFFWAGELPELLEKKHIFSTVCPEDSVVFVIKESKLDRKHHDGFLDGDILTCQKQIFKGFDKESKPSWSLLGETTFKIFPGERMRLVKYDARKLRAIWAPWPPFMTVGKHTKLYGKLARDNAKIMPTLPKPKEAKAPKEVKQENPLSSLSKKERDKLLALLKAA